MALNPVTKVKVPTKPARTYTITYADGRDGLMVAEKMEALEGGTIGFLRRHQRHGAFPRDEPVQLPKHQSEFVGRV